MEKLPVKIRKSNNLFLQLSVILIGIVGGYIYYSQIIKPAKIPIAVPDIPKEDNLNKFKDIKNFDFGIFSDSSFRSLKPLGNVPVMPGETGRDDMFAPF